MLYWTGDIQVTWWCWYYRNIHQIEDLNENLLLAVKIVPGLSNIPGSATGMSQILNYFELWSIMSIPNLTIGKNLGYSLKSPKIISLKGYMNLSLGFTIIYYHFLRVYFMLWTWMINRCIYMLFPFSWSYIHSIKSISYLFLVCPFLYTSIYSLHY
jgi:hypothetical protein